MREPVYPAANNNTTENKVPLSPESRRSKRKMDQRRLGIRGLFKNPPQPHMCIQDTLLGSSEPCFVNVLSWDKISMPSHPKDPIPLYGGIRIFNNSMNSLSFTTTYEGCKPGKQPVIFAVLANTEILKFSGKTAKDPNERDALIYLILDFIEVMNEGVHFSHQFVVMSDRDVVGELKDIWFIIQNKREQERMELSYHGEGDRSTERYSVKTHKRDTASGNIDNCATKEPSWLLLEPEKERLTRSHSYPNGSEKSRDNVWSFSCSDGDGRDNAWFKSTSGCQDVAGGSQTRNIVCVDTAPSCQGDDEEVVLFEHDCMKTAPLTRPSVSLFDYFPSALKGASAKDSRVAGNTSFAESFSKSTPTSGSPPLYREMPSKVAKCPQISSSDCFDRHTNALDRKEINYCLPSFTDIQRAMTSGCAYDKEEPKVALVVDKTGVSTSGLSQVSFDSFDSESEEELFDQVRRVVATEILPTLDSLENENDRALFVAKQDAACAGSNPQMFVSTAEMFSHVPRASNENETTEYAGNVERSDLISVDDGLKFPRSQQVIDMQLTKLAEVLDTLDEHLKSDACNNSNVDPASEKRDAAAMNVADQLSYPLQTAVKPMQSAVEFSEDSVPRNLFNEVGVKVPKANEENCQANAQLLPSSDLAGTNVQAYLLNKVNQYVSDICDSVTTAPNLPVLGYFDKHDKKDSNENFKPFDKCNISEALTPGIIFDTSPAVEDGVSNTSHSINDEINLSEMTGDLNETGLDPDNNVTRLSYDIPCIESLGINNTIKCKSHGEHKCISGCDTMSIEHK